MRFILIVMGVLFVIVMYIFIFALMKASHDTEEVSKPVTTTVPVEAWAKYPVPLDKSMQLHIVEEANRRGVSPALVFAIIQTESDFDANKIGDGGKSYGLMQVYASEHTDRCLALNAINLLDPYANVTVGIDILAELSGYRMPIEWVLMAYNGGMGYATTMYNEGRVSDYANTVKALAEQIAEGVMVCTD